MTWIIFILLGILAAGFIGLLRWLSVINYARLANTIRKDFPNKSVRQKVDLIYKIEHEIGTLTQKVFGKKDIVKERLRAVKKFGETPNLAKYENLINRSASYEKAFFVFAFFYLITMILLSRSL